MREALAAIRDFSQNISWAWLALKRCFCFHSKGLLIPPQRPAYRRGEPVRPSRTVSSMDAGAELTRDVFTACPGRPDGLAAPNRARPVALPLLNHNPTKPL